MGYAEEIQTTIRALQEQYSSGMQAGDRFGESNKALRRMVEDCRIALRDMDDLSDDILPQAVVTFRRQIRDLVAYGREVLKPMNEANAQERESYLRQRERLEGMPAAETEEC